MAGRGSAPGERRGGRRLGTPNKVTDEIRKAAQPYGPPAIERLAELGGLAVDDAGNPVRAAESEAIQVAALRELLDRGFGKPTQPVADDRDVPLILDVRWADALPPVVSEQPQLAADKGAVAEAVDFVWRVNEC